MEPNEKAPGDRVTRAARELEALEEEHAPIVERILGDRNMEERTRELLLGHVREEEEEARQRLLDAAAAARRGPGGRADRGGFTVGSLRPSAGAPGPERAGRGTVGDLRRL